MQGIQRGVVLNERFGVPSYLFTFTGPHCDDNLCFILFLARPLYALARRY